MSAETPVVISKGVCRAQQKTNSPHSCTSVITSAEIDTLIEMLEPKASPTARHQFAVNYSRLVAAAGEAQRRHLEKDPALAKQIQIQQELVRMQLLANTLYRQIETHANNFSLSDIQQFYAGHQEMFVQGEVRRLYIPKPISAASGAGTDLTVLKAKANEARKRIAAGEDFDLVQQEALKDLGMTAATPTTKLNLTGRVNFPVAERTVFDLNPGQVTEVVDSPNAFVVLKLESKQTIPFDSARPDIVLLLQRERAQQEIRSVTENGKTQFNLAYLDLPSVPELFPPPQLATLGAHEGAQSNSAERMPRRRPMASRMREITVLPPSSR